MDLTQWTRYAPRLRKVLFVAVDEAARRGEAEVSAEHILLSILRDTASAGFFVLQHAGADPASVRAAIESRLAPSGHARRYCAPERLTPSARRALELAAVESGKLRNRHIGTEHVLLGLITGTAGPAGAVLDASGVTYGAATRGISAWVGAGMPRASTPRPRVRVPLRVQILLEPIDQRVIAPLTRMVKLGYDVFWKRSLGHPGYVSRPYPLYRWLRSHAPVRKDPMSPVWTLTRYEDVAMLLRDPRFKRDPFNPDNLPADIRRDLGWSTAGGGTDAVDVLAQQMLFLDPPRHTRLRGLLAKAFTPRVVQTLRPRVEQIATELLDRVVPSGRMDVIRDFAYPLPTKVIAELLGFPPDDYEKLKAWSDDFAALLALNPTSEEQDRAARSIEAMSVYFEATVARLRASPRENLLSSLLAVEEQGQRLTSVELFANCVLLLAAGHETTTNLIGNGLLALIRNPLEMQRLRNDPSLIESAVEELLRFDSPVQWTSRIAGETIHLGGHTLEAGDFVLGSLGAANRDPAVFSKPDTLDLSRQDNRHLAFGQGIHFCLGAALARLEAQIAINQLLARCPSIRLAKRRLKWRPGVVFRGLREFPVTFKTVGSNS